MDSKQSSHFVVDFVNFVFQIAGKPLPCNLQRKLDEYPTEKESNVTLNIKKAAMVYINDRLSCDESLADVASQIYEAELKELLKKYTPRHFLKLLSHFAFSSVLERSNNKPEVVYASLLHFLERLRNKMRFDVGFWEKLDQTAATIIEENRNKNNYRPLQQTKTDLDMSSEKGFVLKIMNYIFDFYCRNLPDYLQTALDGHVISQNDPNLKNSVFVILNQLGKKVQILGEIEPIVLYYYNLTSMHFREKYFLEFCVCCTKKALLEYSNESRNHSPLKAFELLVYILHLAKEQGKFDSLEAMNNASSQVLEDDRERIEHERMRQAVLGDVSGESSRQANDSENLIDSSDYSKVDECKCCILT